jgi:serine/threonine-protein kinase
MSPEQLSGMDVGPASDLYAAGVVLFECVTGKLPFEAETTWALVAKRLEEEAPDPRTVNPEVPEGLAKIIVRAMAKDPGDRYQSAGEMHDALAAIE